MSLPDPHAIALVRQMMATLGVTTADLAAPTDGAEDHSVVGGAMPTVRAYHDTILELVTPGQQRT